MDCSLNCASMDEVRANHSIDPFVTMVLGGALGRMIDLGVPRCDIFTVISELLNRMEIVQQSPQAQKAFNAFADSLQLQGK